MSVPDLDPRLAGFDLNLLKVLDALHREGSATAAAARLGISQPTVSVGLQKLRRLLDDPLFIKTRGGLEPTPRCQELQESVAYILFALQEKVLERARFDPATTDRVFSLMIGEIGQIVFVPRLLQLLAREAPGVRLHVLTTSVHDRDDPLEARGADLAIGSYPNLLKPTYYQQRLYVSRLVCITRTGNPLVPGQLDRERFLALEHALFGGDHHYFSVYSQALKQLGAQLKVRVQLPNVSAVAAILQTSNLLAVMPASLAEHCQRQADLAIHPLPLPFPTIEVRQYWHRRRHHDPAVSWLRRQIAGLLQTEPGQGGLA